MINAWSLLYDEIYGDDEMSDEIKITTNEDNPTFNVGSGSTASATFVNFDLTDEINNVSIDTSNYTVDFDGLENNAVYAGDTLGSSGYETLNITVPDEYNFTMPDELPLLVLKISTSK